MDVLERLNTGPVDLTCESCTHFSDPSTSDCPKEWLKLAVLRGDERGSVISPGKQCIDEVVKLPSSREPLKTANEVEVYLRGQAGFSSLKGVPVISQCLSEPVKVSRVGNWSATAFNRTLPESNHKVALAEYYSDLHRLDQGMGEAVDNIAAIDRLIAPAGDELLKDVSCSKMLSKEAEESCKAVSQCKSGSSEDAGSRQTAMNQAAHNTIMAMQAINEIEAKLKQLRASGNMRRSLGPRPTNWRAQIERLESSKQDIENLYPWVVGRKFQSAYSSDDFKGFTGSNAENNQELIGKMSGIITEQLTHTREKLQERQEEMYQVSRCLTENKFCNDVDIEKVLSTTRSLDEEALFASTEDLKSVSSSALFSQVNCLQEQRRIKAEMNKELAFAGLDLAIMAGTMGLGSGIVGAKMAATAAIRAGGAASKAQKLSGVQRLQGLGVIGADAGASTPFMNEAMKQCDSLLNQLESVGEQRKNNKEDLCESMSLQVKHTSDLKGCMLQAGLASMPAVFGVGALAGGLAIGARVGSRSVQVIEALGNDISGLTRKQIRGLGTKVKHFTPSQLATLGDNVQHLTQRQLRALGDNVQHLTQRQLQALGNKVEHLTKKQFRALGDKVDDLTPEQRRAWVYSNFVDPAQRERMIRELNSGSGNRSVLSAAAADINKAEDVLGKKLTDEQAEAVQKAHLVGASDELGKDGINPPGIGNYTEAQLREKNKILQAAGFSPADRRSLIEAGVVGRSLLDVQAIKKIPASDIEKLTPDEIQKISPEDFTFFTSQQVQGLGDNVQHLTLSQVTALGNKVSHFTPQQVRALGDSVSGFTPQQVRALGDNVEHFTPSQVTALGNKAQHLTPSQIQALGYSVRGFTPHQVEALGDNVGHFTPQQFQALGDSVSGFTPQQVRALGDKFNYLDRVQFPALGDKVQYLTPQQVRAFAGSDEFNYLNRVQLQALGNTIRAITPEQLQKMWPFKINALTQEQFRALGDRVASFTPHQIEELSPLKVKTLTRGQLAALGNKVSAFTRVKQLRALGDKVGHFTPQQIRALGWRINYLNFDYLGNNIIRNLTPKQLQQVWGFTLKDITPQQVRALGDKVKYFNEEQFQKMGNKVVSHFTPQQVEALGDNVRHLTSQQLRALGDNVQHLTPQQVRALGDNVRHLTSQQYQVIKEIK